MAERSPVSDARPAFARDTIEDPSNVQAAEGPFEGERLSRLVAGLLPGARLAHAAPLGADGHAEGGTAKGSGYGVPLRLVVWHDGRNRTLVLHTARADAFGHDRRADRAHELLQAYDTFGRVPRHARALDVGAFGRGGEVVSLADAGEFYLLTEYAPGRTYATDLRRIAKGGEASAGDVDRARSLARYLVELHRARRPDPARYARALRDLVGHGEGVAGVVDNYGPDVPSAPPARLQAIEAACLAARWRLRERGGARLCRTHGDFHPFNIVFDEGGSLALLDASRGCEGDAADDVTCLAINFVFFALEAEGAWAKGFRPLWQAFWGAYLGESRDPDVLGATPPYLAWRALVIGNPTFYPRLAPSTRDRLLGLAERALAAGTFDPDWADEAVG
jgi:aminoglycoside phosphotransferase (APT) family kinase protein